MFLLLNWEINLSTGHNTTDLLTTKVQDLTDHRAFSRKLKTFLFERAFLSSSSSFLPSVIHPEAADDGAGW